MTIGGEDRGPSPLPDPKWLGSSPHPSNEWSRSAAYRTASTSGMSFGGPCEIPRTRDAQRRGGVEGCYTPRRESAKGLACSDDSWRGIGSGHRFRG